MCLVPIASPISPNHGSILSYLAAQQKLTTKPQMPLVE